MPETAASGREVIAVIAAGGALGALARYGLSLALPHAPGDFAWPTFWTNVSGCFLMGVLMVAVTEFRRPHPLVHPFLGTGFLGGFTTFSTFVVDSQHGLETGRPGTGLLYLAVTAVTALSAVFAGVHLTRLFARQGGRT